MKSTVAEDQLRALAQRLWEEAGRPQGQSDEFWNAAQRQLASESGMGVAPGPGLAENTAASD